MNSRNNDPHMVLVITFVWVLTLIAAAGIACELNNNTWEHEAVANGVGTYVTGEGGIEHFKWRATDE